VFFINTSNLVMLRRLASSALVALALALPSCSTDNALVLADAAHDASAAAAAKAILLDRAHDLAQAAQSLRIAAPSTAAGWQDAAAIAAMRGAWKDAHRAYRQVSGASGMLFPELAEELDGRYEEALARGADPYLFDDEGFFGLHAVERVLWADAIPAGVLAKESAWEGYVAPAFPATDEEAADFRAALCARLVAESEELEQKIEALDLESPAAYEAAVRLVEAELDELVEAGEGLDFSRYAAFSLADLRASLASAEATHAVFRDWLLTKEEGAHVDGEIAEGFARLSQAFASIEGDAIPSPPEGWSATAPTSAMQATPFGALFAAVHAESDDTTDGSLAHSMDEAAGLLGIHGAE
jgi:iron uptake system component EfeO